MPETAVTVSARPRRLDTARKLTDRSAIGSMTRAAIILIVALAVAALPSSSAAAPAGGSPGKGRMAIDLQEIVQTASATRMVRVVVNLKTWTHAKDVAARAEELGGQVRAGHKNVRQMVLDLPAGSVPQLLVVVGLDYMTPDRPVASLASHLETTTGASQVHSPSFDTPLSSFLISGGLKGYDGTGVTVAVVDSGIYPDHFDLREGGRNRTVVHSVDFVRGGSSGDPFGHGTHVGGIIAGNGSSSLQSGSDYSGVAPGASLVSLRVLDDHGRGRLSDVIAAVDFAIANRQAHGIRVLNLSLAAPPVDSYRDDPLCQAVDRAAAAGIVVVTAAGNFGVDPYARQVYGGITSPGICPAAITVGAVDTRGTDARSDDMVAAWSSRGPTRSYAPNPSTGEPIHDNLAKPDLVAPGAAIVSLESPDNTLVRYFPHIHVGMKGDSPRSRYMTLSGSSMSTGVVSGAVALMLQANPSLTPNLTRAVLMYSAQILDGEDLFAQGAGLLNVEGAMRIARSLRKDADTRLPGQTLSQASFPRPQSTIAREPVDWGQGLVWGDALVGGSATLTRQQEAYAQGLIWGLGGWRVWGANVTFSEGLYTESYVVYGDHGTWSGVEWDHGTTLENGVRLRDDLSASGVAWSGDLMMDDFYSLSPTGLIWGRMAYDVGLIWGLDRFLCGMGLIWGYGFGWSVL